MSKPETTAVGRLLKVKSSASRIYKIIAVSANGAVKTILEKPMQ